MKFKKPKFWDDSKISFWSILLFPISIIYSILFSLLKFLMSFKNNKAEIPIICVGNIYLGGTGKTPLVKEIFSIVKTLGKNPAFIKKKYDYLIDEIKMLEKDGKTFVCNNRISGISQCSKNGFDVAILDDGFQDFTIRPNLSILCFNSKQLVGNGFVIPSGPLRENFSSISKANCIVINGNKNLEFEKKIFNHTENKKVHIFYSKYKINNLEKFKNKEITAIAGIGNPSNFFDLLKENNIKIKKTFSFPDHHYYSEKDFDKITQDNNSKIVTTEKDFYRMNEKQKQICDYVEVKLHIENKDEFKKLIQSYL